jgi:glycosyltransferase involved in cell wall biosynthesis
MTRSVEETMEQPEQAFGGDESRTRHVCLNALNGTLGGGITVVRNLAEQLPSLRPNWRFTLLHSHPAAAPADPAPNLALEYRGDLRPVLRRWAWEQLRLPSFLSRGRFDLMLCAGGFTCFGTGVRQVSVWQNPNILSRLRIPRSWRTHAYIRAQRIVQSLSMRKAVFNIFLTEDSLEMAKTRWPMDRFPHTAIYSGVDLANVVVDSVPALATREPFVLAVSHTYYHKNYEPLIDAIAVYKRRFGTELRLKIAGGSYDVRHHERLIRRAAQQGVADVVEFLGATPAEEVAQLYRTATAYVTTSLLETFGLTTLEAMGHGLPVVAGRATCFPEVCGEAALYCDPRDAEDIALKLHSVCTDAELAQSLRERGFNRVREFSWSRTGEAYARVLDGVVR